MDIVYIFCRSAALIVLGTETASFHDPQESFNYLFGKLCAGDAFYDADDLIEIHSLSVRTV